MGVCTHRSGHSSVTAIVMLVVLALLCRTALAQAAAPASYAPYPEPGPGYVTDHADLLSDEQEERIEQRLWEVEEQTGVEIVIVLIDSMSDYPGAPQGSIEAFATGLFDTYGIGNMPVNNGVLLLVAKSDREARIELGKAYGQNRNGDANRIMQGTIIPAFKQGDYAGGIEEGASALMLEFAGVRYGTNWPLILGVASVPVLVLIAVSLFRSGQRGWGWVVVGVLAIILLALLRILFAVIRSAAEHSDRGSSSGWSSGGFGGGFGGGSSGGGGASGSW